MITIIDRYSQLENAISQLLEDQYVIVDPAAGTVDASHVITVQALDSFGNVATTETRDVTLLAVGQTSGDTYLDASSSTNLVPI